MNTKVLLYGEYDTFSRMLLHLLEYREPIRSYTKLVLIARDIHYIHGDTPYN